MKCFVSLWARAPGGREGDKKWLTAPSLALFGNGPNMASSGERLIYARRRLEYAMRYKELKDAVENWLNKTLQHDQERC